MDLHGKNLLGSQTSQAGGHAFHALDPTTGAALEPIFRDASSAEAARACELAAAAFDAYRALSGARRADFLEAIADALLELGDALLERAGRETALPAAHLTGERGRTMGQLRLFASVAREGSWVDARIDPAQPERSPLPRPDVRRLLVPLGPAAIFGASNFPLAFSVAGGDTASALAAGCPVVVKAHPAHPGTSEMVGRAILAAAEKTGMPEGVFSMVHGQGHEIGHALVTDPRIQAVGFTGSFRGGRALWEAANQRETPIPFYAEMGSVNPVFVLPGAIRARGEALADGLAGSVTLGAGQFCTNPGLTLVLDDADSKAWVGAVAQRLAAGPAGTAVHPGIKIAYDVALSEVTAIEHVEVVGRSTAVGAHPDTALAPTLLLTDSAAWTDNPRLGREVYGPATVAVRCSSAAQMVDIARSLEGHLTATLLATEDELAEHRELVEVLQNKVGRLIFNGFPTGVEVCPAMHHGGPYPATTDVRSTSVGTAAIQRFARPLCWQDFPDAALPEALRDGNPLGIWRLVDGELVRG